MAVVLVGLVFVFTLFLSLQTKIYFGRWVGVRIYIYTVYIYIPQDVTPYVTFIFKSVVG